MINIPVCSHSQQEASKFCIDKNCLKDPWICRRCNDEACQIAHVHNGHIEVIRCEEVLPRVQNIYMMLDVEVPEFKELLRLADSLILQVRDIVDSSVKSMRRLRESLNIRPEIQRVIDALRNREGPSLKGCEMRRMVEVLNQGNPYLNRNEVFDEIRFREASCMRLLTDISKRLADFNNEERKKLRPLQERAQQLKRQGMLKQAADLYSQVLRIEKSGKDYNSRGTLYFNMNDFEKALEDFSRAIQCDGSKPIYHHNRGKAYDSMQNHQAAIKEFTLAIELDPKPELYDRRGSAFYSIERFDYAVADYTKAIELDPKNPLYLFNRANSYYSMKDYGKAEKDYSQAILFSSGNSWYYFNRGMVYSEVGNLQEAIKDFNRAIQLDPRVAKFHNSLGFAYFKMKCYDQALGPFKEAIQLDTFKAEYYNNRGNALSGLKRYTEALDDYNRAIKLDGSHADYFNNRGNLYNVMQNYIKALEDFNESIRLNGRHYLFFQNRAIIMERLQRYDEAEQDKRKSEELLQLRKRA